MTLFYTR